MKEKCQIVQDLLPNYIEKLTKEQTNQFIEKHLEECNDCKEVLENMQKDIKINNAKRDGREIKYMKKFNGEMKKFKIFKRIILTVAIILLIFIITLIYKYNIIFNMQRSYDNLKYKNNIYFTKQENDSLAEFYKKDMKLKIVHYDIREGEKKLQGIEWADAETNENLLIFPNTKTYIHHIMNVFSLR